jgi:HAD superfamily hydrolase (TIGR01509 family)
MVAPPPPESDAPRAVLWDLDGTLVDSAPYHWLAWREALAAFGREVRPEDFSGAFGKRNDAILRELCGPDVSATWIGRVSAAKEERYRRYVREQGLEPLPGALEWLSRLRATGWKQAIASSGPPPNIDAALAALGLDRSFDAVVSGHEVGRGKPDPAIFIAAATRLGVPASRCVVVEDAPAGLEGARRAGMRSVGVLSSHHPSLEADLVVPSLASLPPDAFDSLLSTRPR